MRLSHKRQATNAEGPAVTQRGKKKVQKNVTGKVKRTTGQNPDKSKSTNAEPTGKKQRVPIVITSKEPTKALNHTTRVSGHLKAVSERVQKATESLSQLKKFGNPFRDDVTQAQKSKKAVDTSSSMLKVGAARRKKEEKPVETSAKTKGKVSTERTNRIGNRMSEMDKAALKAAIIAGTKVAAEQTLSAMGYNTIAEDGWVVRIYENGERKKIKKIA